MTLWRLCNCKLSAFLPRFVKETEKRICNRIKQQNSLYMWTCFLTMYLTCVFKVCLSSEILDYENCLLRYRYAKEIELINSSNVPAWYGMVSMNDSDKTLATMETDAVCGIVPPYSQKPLKLTIQTQKLGQVSFSVTVNISGKDSKPLMLTITAFSCGPSIEIEQPSLDAKDATMSSGQPGENDAALDFGKVQVLQDHLRILLLKNMSCIPAELKISLSKKKTVFRIERDGLALKPFESQELTVSSNFSLKVHALVTNH